MTDYPHFIILAAGQGTRFRGEQQTHQHKALAPLWDPRGTLELMLGHLQALNQPELAITLATGYLADMVEQRARQVVPDLRVAYNDTYADDTLLDTLVKTVGTLPEVQGFWVLFADTVYSRQSLQLLQQHRQTRPTIAIMRREHGSQGDVTVTLKPDGRVDAFQRPDAPYQMAHAVFWPGTRYWRQYCQPLLAQAGLAHPLPSQWALLKQLDDVAALMLPDHSAQDIDTPAQLDQLRPQLTPQVLAYFHDNLNKDRRSVVARDRRQRDDYLKHCESPCAAQHEAKVLRLLNQQLPDIAPALIGVEGRVITMRLASGVRLYDLLRQLTTSPAHQRIKGILQARCSERLSRIQQVLSVASVAHDPYPFGWQVCQLLETLCTLLRLSPPPQHELAQLAVKWTALCTVPFRDATPKNIIVADPSVCPSLDAPQRQKAIAWLLQQKEVYWQEVPLQDIDFTSTCHLSSQQDDWLSLLGHAVNLPQPDWRWPDACWPLCDLTLLVRYLRFGGRKLVYKMVNPSGFQVRFRYDEPCFYFVALCTHLSSDFQQRYPHLMQTLRAIRDKAELFRGISLSGEADPYVSSHLNLQRPRYWQESPLEVS